MRTIPYRSNVLTGGAVISFGGVKVGIFGVGYTPDAGEKGGKPSDGRALAYPALNPTETVVEQSIEKMRAMGAEFIVALTHLPWDEDQALIDKYASKGLGLLVGGHDHTNMTLCDEQGKTVGVKADSDARTAWRIDVRITPGGNPEFEPKLIALNEIYAPADLDLKRIADKWYVKAGKRICAERARRRNEPYDEKCLEKAVGRAQFAIELEESANRTKETVFGDWLADTVATKMGADIAIINAGILGLNEDLEAGSEIRVRHIEDIFRFNDIVAVKKISAKTVCNAVAHGFNTPGAGAWPHVSGLEVELKLSPKGNKATVTRFGKGELDCQSKDMVSVAAVPYLLCNGDGYKFLEFAGDKETCREEIRSMQKEKHYLSDIAEDAIRVGGDRGVAVEKKANRIKFIPSDVVTKNGRACSPAVTFAQ